jgi:hypothetical protein
LSVVVAVAVATAVAAVAAVKFDKQPGYPLPLVRLQP